MSLAGIGILQVLLQPSFFGGPEQCFDVIWLLFRVSTAVEATLAQIYKEKHLGSVSWRSRFYIERGLGGNGLPFCSLLFYNLRVYCQGVQAVQG
jgi:AGCS family alanine or glycine:cation symporter